MINRTPMILLLVFALWSSIGFANTLEAIISGSWSASSGGSGVYSDFWDAGLTLIDINSMPTGPTGPTTNGFNTSYSHTGSASSQNTAPLTVENSFGNYSLHIQNMGSQPARLKIDVEYGFDIMGDADAGATIDIRCLGPNGCTDGEITSTNLNWSVLGLGPVETITSSGAFQGAIAGWVVRDGVGVGSDGLDPTDPRIKATIIVLLDTAGIFSLFSSLLSQSFLSSSVVTESIQITVVPVPAAVWLFGSALGVLGWMRRKTA